MRIAGSSRVLGSDQADGRGRLESEAHFDAENRYFDSFHNTYFRTSMEGATGC
jgi:hypothetical protein